MKNPAFAFSMRIRILFYFSCGFCEALFPFMLSFIGSADFCSGRLRGVAHDIFALARQLRSVAHIAFCENRSKN